MIFISSIAEDTKLYNGGRKCDLLFGPCSCGAWHEFKTRSANNFDEIKRVYIHYLLGEGKKDE